MKFQTIRKTQWTLEELSTLRYETEAAFRAAMIAADIVELAMKHKGDPDAFYANVASAYRRFELVTGRPTASIAEAARVPHTTAARWVRVARQKGMIA